MPESFPYGVKVALVIGCLWGASTACDTTPPRQDPVELLPLGSEPGRGQVDRRIRSSGSSALQPLINAAKEQLERTSSKTNVELSAGGSKKGLIDVASGAVQIGNSDIFAPDDLRGQLMDHKVAVVGIVAMANKGPFNERLHSLSIAQLAQIFSGEAKNWRDVGGEPQPIFVINRAAGSGTRIVFGNRVMGEDRFMETQTEDNSGALVSKLKQIKGSISYLALSFQDEALWSIPLHIENKIIEPSVANITRGLYPLWSYEHMYTKGEPSGAAKDFIGYILSAQFQNYVLPHVKGFVPISSMNIQREND